MGKRISWGETPGARLTVYTVIKNLNGGYDENRGQRVAFDDEKGLLKRVATAMAIAGFPNFDEDKGDAIGMQHTWAVGTQNLRECPPADRNSQLQRIFVNRVAAVKAGYMTKIQAIQLFQKNHAPRETMEFFDVALAASDDLLKPILKGLRDLNYVDCQTSMD